MERRRPFASLPGTLPLAQMRVNSPQGTYTHAEELGHLGSLCALKPQMWPGWPTFPPKNSPEGGPSLPSPVF